MTTNDPEQMSRGELIREVRKLGAAGLRDSEALKDADPQRLIHQLHLHEIELELQNQELRDAQQLLEVSRSRYVELYDLAPVGYCTLDLDARIGELNLAAAALFREDREAMIGRPLFAVVTPAAQRDLQGFLARCGGEHKATIDIALASGVAVQLVGVSLRDPHGAVAGYRLALNDITELKQLETRLRFLATTGETLGSSLDYQLTLTTVTRVAVPLLADICFIDIVADDGAVQRLDVVFADQKRFAGMARSVQNLGALPGRKTPQQSVIASGQPLLVRDIPQGLLAHIAHDDPDGTVMRSLDMRSMIVVPLWTQGRTLGALTFIGCVTRRRYQPADLLFAEDIARRAAVAIDVARAYARAQRAVGLRDGILAVVSHDLRNPLGLILARAEQLARADPVVDGTAPTLKAIEAILRAGRRMNRLVDDLIDFSSIEAGQLSMQLVRQPAAAVIREAIDAADAIAAKLRITLSSRVSDLVELDTDPGRLRQVLVNLIEKALAFTPAGGSVTVSCEVVGDEVVFAVADTGIGIARDELPLIFDRFWRERGSPRTGTGLGLSIASAIVKAHRGRIWADSTPGVGTTFYVALPAVTG